MISGSPDTHSINIKCCTALGILKRESMANDRVDLPLMCASTRLSMSAADEQQYISVSFLSPLRWHIMLGALRTYYFFFTNMTTCTVTKCRCFISLKLSKATIFPKKWLVQKESIRSHCCCHSHPSLTGWACQSLALCPLTSRALLPIFSPLFIAYWSTKEATHMSYFLKELLNFQFLYKIWTWAKRARVFLDGNSGLGSWWVHDKRPVIKPEKQL